MAPSSLQGHLYVFPRVGLGFSDMGTLLSWGGQVGYGNESWGKVFFDILIIGFDESINILGLYEYKTGSLYLQFGLGVVVDQYYYEDYFEDYDYDTAGGIGIRVGLGYNYALNKYIMIRPAIELNLGLKEHQSNWAINLNFGFKTPNLW